MKSEEILILLKDINENSVQELDSRYSAVVSEKGVVTAADLPGIFETLAEYHVDLHHVIKSFQKKPEGKPIELEKIKKNLKKYLTIDVGKDKIPNHHHKDEEKTIKGLEADVSEKVEPMDLEKVDRLEEKRELNKSFDKIDEGFEMITEVRNQDSDGSKKSSKQSSRSGSVSSGKRLSKLADYGKNKKKKTATKKKKAELKTSNKKNNILSISGLADVSKNITFSTNNKLIRYKFEDLTFTEFQKRLDSHDYIITEKLEKNYPPKQLLVDLLSLCRIVPKPEEVQLFNKELKQLHPESSGKPSKPKMAQSAFRALCEKWFNEVHFPKDLKSKLVVSIKEYETMKSKMMPNEDPTFIDSLITMLKSQLRKVLETSKKQSVTTGLEERLWGGCHEVFIFYSKNSLNPAVSSSDSKKKFEFVTLPKFLRFAEDFNILEKHKNPEKNRIKKESLEEIFDKNSNPKKDMHEYQFCQALEHLSELFFDEQYDQVNKTQWKTLNQDLKILKFLEILGFHESSVYSRKMKGNKYADMNSLVKYSFDVSKNLTRTPKNFGKAQSSDRTLSKVSSVNYEKSNSQAKPITWDQLAKGSANEDLDLMNLINEDSSEDEPIMKMSMNKKSNHNSISQKVLSRADELMRQEKKQESEKIKQLMKLADNRNEKQLSVSKRFK